MLRLSLSAKLPRLSVHLQQHVVNEARSENALFQEALSFVDKDWIPLSKDSPPLSFRAISEKMPDSPVCNCRFSFRSMHALRGDQR